MEYYKVKSDPIPGKHTAEVAKIARQAYKQASKSTRRQPYVRCKYFNNQKVFISSFWEHLNQKSLLDRRRRLKLLPCAIELMRDANLKPMTQQNPADSRAVVHRFFGETKSGVRFCVQVSETKLSKKRYFMSVFPE
jgi:hypothetical protein